jgi:hypothetical protein
MLTQLATIKARLDIAPADTTRDDLLTRAIQAVSERFDHECNRRFARVVGATQEFLADDTEVSLLRFPIESVAKWELKTTETEGWVEQTDVACLLRPGGVISLGMPLSFTRQAWSFGPRLARVTYTGGYVLPGTTPGQGQTPLPPDIEFAAQEQVAAWFQHRDKLGLVRYWPSGGTFLVFTQAPLLPTVSAALRPYRRWGL